MTASAANTDFGFGENDDSISSGKFERFKAKEGETYRVSFVWWPTDESGRPNMSAKTPRFKGAKRFFIDNVGYVLDKGPEIAKIAGGPSKMTIASILAIWPTDRKGNLDKERFVRGDVDIKPWVFSAQVYEVLARRHEELHLGEWDLKIACTDTQFQKLDIQACKDNLFRKALETPKLANVVASMLSSIASIEGGIESLIARDMTPEQIREKLGGPAANTASLGGSFSTSDVDSLLGDLLDT